MGADYDIKTITRAALDYALEWIPVRVIADLDERLKLPAEQKAAAIQEARDYLASLEILVAEKRSPDGDPLSQSVIESINSNPITRRAFSKLADAYESGKL